MKISDLTLNQDNLAGDYPLTKTLQTKFCYGGILQGVACSPHIKARHSHRGPATILHKTQNFVGPLMEIQGAYFSLRDLSLIGKTFKSQAKPHPLGVQITRPRRGIGSGKHHFSRVYIEFVETAWCLGDKPSMVACDCCSWESPIIRKANCAFLSLNHQSMQHRITHCALQQVNTFLDIRGGGCWYVDDVGMMSARDKGTKPTLLRVEQIRWPNGKARVTIGSNNGYYEIRNLKTDNKAGKVILLNQVNPAPIVVRLIGGKLVHEPSAFLNSGGSLLVEGYSYLGKNFLTWTNRTPHRRKAACTPNFTLRDSLVSDRVTSPTDLLNLSDSIGNLNVCIENNYRYPSGDKLPDFNGTYRAKAG